MADKKVTPPLGAYPGGPPQPQGPFLPGPPQHAAPQYGNAVPGYHCLGQACSDELLMRHSHVASGSPYGMAFGGAGGGGGAGQLYAAPPPYDQALAAAQHHQPMGAIGQQQMYSPAAAMYAAAAGYPGYIGYPVQYYPYYPAAAAAAAAAAAMQPSIQQLRPTIMIPNGFEAGARFDGVGAPLLPPAPPGVPPTPAQLAAMAGHQVALGQKRATFLNGTGDGGYTFW